MKKSIISTSNAPAAVGAYSQAIVAGDFLFASGQLGLDPSTGLFKGSDVESQSRQALQNLQAVLSSADFSLNDVVKTTVFLADMASFAAFNDVYKSFFNSSAPARSCVAVKSLPKNALVEIDVIAAK